MAHRYNSSRATVAAGQRNCNYKTNGKPATHIVNATIFNKEYDQPIVVLSQTAHMMHPRIATLIDAFGTVTLVRDAMFVDYYHITVVVEGVRKCRCIHYQSDGECSHVDRVEAFNAGLVVAAPVEVQDATALVIGKIRQQAASLTTSDVQEVA